MFTGLVEALAAVVEVREEPPGQRLRVREAAIAAGAGVGDSIAVNGCCLTVVAVQDDTFSFQAGPETLARTNLGQLQKGGQVNLERSVKVGDLLGGHFVTGHIDAVGTLDAYEDEGEWRTCWFRFPPRLGGQMVSKGSIAVDGISLTLVDVEDERFSVALIPHTLQVTTLGELPPGGVVNLETDLLAKYVEKQLAGERLRE